MPLSAANAGISGNRVLQDGQIPMFGTSALSRFTRDAIDIPGVSTIVILEGTNDIGQSNATANQITTGLSQLVAMAKAAHIHVLLGTLTPMAQATEPGTYSGAASNATRLAVNDWIRTQRIADGFIDFAKTVQDLSDPSTMAPAYNGGDGLALHSRRIPSPSRRDQPHPAPDARLRTADLAAHQAAFDRQTPPRSSPRLNPAAVQSHRRRSPDTRRRNLNRGTSSAHQPARDCCAPTALQPCGTCQRQRHPDW
jgi:lysophospholipase L1-like esterase